MAHQIEIKITDNTDEVMRVLESRMEAALEGVGAFLAGEAADELENDPRRVDTGRLKGSMEWGVDMSDKSVTIGTPVEYAIYVHEGTSRMTPNRFLANALEHNEDQLGPYIAGYLADE